MKCVATGAETNMLSKNIPLSREGRAIITEKHIEYNALLKDKFINEQLELNGNILTKEHLEKIAPKVSKNFFLKLVNQETIEGAFKKLEEAGKKEEKENEA